MCTGVGVGVGLMCLFDSQHGVRDGGFRPVAWGPAKKLTVASAAALATLWLTSRALARTA
jgi:hypothetical protein